MNDCSPSGAVLTRRLTVPERYDLARSVGRIAVIPRDPTVAAGGREAWWATRTPDGPGTIELRREGSELVGTGYGRGAGWLVERADAIAGLRDDVSGFDALSHAHPVVRRLAREYAGMRLPSTGRIFHHLVPAILGQKVTGGEAYRGYVRMLAHFAQPAPGPHPRLRLPPDPVAVAASPYWLFHPWGVEQRRADTIRRAAQRAVALESAVDSPHTTRMLTAIAGIGAWTAAEVVRVAFGDADAVSVGDFHWKNTVAYALAGEVRGTDERMLQLLEPFRGHRGRVCLLLETGGLMAPRFGPRMPVRSFARI
jgi:3-methyladenine DNA glycosylase/8-oxoguanine DNA glycosylase